MRVESHLKRLGDDRTLNFAQRYHYNSLATRYASFRELWRRTLQDREEGRGSAAAAQPLRASRRRHLSVPSSPALMFVTTCRPSKVSTTR